MIEKIWMAWLLSEPSTDFDTAATMVMPSVASLSTVTGMFKTEIPAPTGSGWLQVSVPVPPGQDQPNAETGLEVSPVGITTVSIRPVGEPKPTAWVTTMV